MAQKINGDIIVKDGSTNLRSLKELNTQVTNNVNNIGNINTNINSINNSINALNTNVSTQYANGSSVSINSLNTNGCWRIYINTGTADANYLGFYGNIIVETFVQSSNNPCIQRITKMLDGTQYLRYCATNSFSYSDPLYMLTQNQPVKLWSGTLNAGGSVTLSDNIGNYKFLLFKPDAGITYIQCPILSGTNAVRGTNVYTGASNLEIYGLLGTYSGKTFSFTRLLVLSITTAGAVSKSNYSTVTEIWGVK